MVQGRSQRFGAVCGYSFNNSLADTLSGPQLTCGVFGNAFGTTIASIG
jgi:hypothetical protein